MSTVEEATINTYTGPVVIRFDEFSVDAEAELEDVQETRVYPTFGGVQRVPGRQKVRGTISPREFRNQPPDRVAEFLDKAYVVLRLEDGDEMRGQVEHANFDRLTFEGERVFKAEN